MAQDAGGAAMEQGATINVGAGAPNVGVGKAAVSLHDKVLTRATSVDNVDFGSPNDSIVSAGPHVPDLYAAPAK